MRIILTITSVLLWCFIAQGSDRPLVDYVNTLQGTNSHHELTRGNTYPTTALPFAMHTWTPQTGNNGDGWKYQYQKDTIRGFQQAHQCSSWTNDYAVFSLMPVIGELEVNEHKRASKFSHDHETARPNYYQVKFDNGINTEISPSWRGAHIRFSFPQGQKAYIVLDGYTTPSMVNIDPDNCKITGYVKVTRGRKPNFFNHFVLEFDQPVISYGTWENRDNTIEPGALSRQGRGAGAYLEFAPGTAVQVKVASSYISPEQAQLNLDRELGGHVDLEATRAAAGKVWNDHLGRIAVSGGTDEDTATFYSCFFRASLFSRMFHEFDVNNEPYYFS
ncbi:MAG: glycoside hydrolase family 92 protein, partial [Sedimentisphaerales bacterium]|nr:glycoside hydrolase family 92 protein [Sedimentisphaerales bacterium]